MSFTAVGQVWDRAGLIDHVRSLDLSWASGITLHHTASPNLAQRPRGFSVQHIRNIAHYYEHQLGWRSGPHLFCDDDQVFGMSPLDRPGVHARSYNRTHIGIEVLGDYNRESPDSGRGAACWDTAAGAVAVLLARMGRGIDAVNFHCDDPQTQKSCPGTRVKKRWVQSLILSQPIDDRSDPPGSGSDVARAAIEAIEWQVAKLKRLL